MIYAHTMCIYVYTCICRIVELCKIPATARLGTQLRGLCMHVCMFL